jgi:hypothetical protein
MAKHFVWALSIFGASLSFASSETDKTLPFITTEYESVSAPDEPGGRKTVAQIRKTEVSAQELTRLIASMRETVCAAMNQGSFRVWIRGGASGMIFGIGSSAESGLEVTIVCKP